MSVEMMTAEEVKARFPKGSRVQLHPATDDWMRGDRYGVVVGYGRAREYVGPSNTRYKMRPVLVKLDKSGKTKRHNAHNLLSVDRDEDDKALRRNSSKRNPEGRLIDSIGPGDRVTIVDRFGKERSGKAVMRSSHGGWVLNMGGRYGTPGIADDSNVVRVSKSKKKPSGTAYFVAGRAPNPDSPCPHCGAFAQRCASDVPRRRATVCMMTGKVLKKWDRKNMKRKRNPARGTANEHHVRELTLYADNTASLQNQYNSIILNLLRKYAAGKYDRSKAWKLWKYWFDSAAKSYTKEFDAPGGGMHGSYGAFSAADREQAAKDYAIGIQASLERGEFDEMLMKLGGIHAERLASLRGQYSAKHNPRARDPAHKKLLRSLDEHFAMDERAGKRQKNPSQGGTGKTPYQRMKAAGVEMDSHETDLYVPANATTRKIIADLKRDGWIISEATFISKIDEKPWIELPFYYEPAWGRSPVVKKNPRSKAFVIALYMGGPKGKRLTFSSSKLRFTDDKKPALYATQNGAADRARELIAKYAQLKKYRITVEQATQAERGEVFGARPVLGNPSLRDGKTEEQAGYAVSYTYVSPGRAGPFRGKDVLNWKPSKGDQIRAPFGLAIVKSVRKIRPKT